MIVTLQLVNAALTLLFGILATLAWRRLGAERWSKTQAGWLLTGACFLLVGGFGAVHAIASAWAVRVGRDSLLYQLLAEWGPAGNIGREAGVAAYGVMLATLVGAPAERVRQVAAGGLWVIGATTVGGTAAAALYGPIDTHTHMTTLAVLATAAVLALLLSLLIGVMNDGMDLLLWLAVAAHTIKEALVVSLMAILAWWDSARAFEAALIFYWINVAVAVVASDLGRAIENRHVPALFERLHALRRPAES
ncbi:MAG TPA: hypothetical protein VEY93_12875 [Longimicrobium sp.]|nr:hypothetical protein [Longimicrobium sp.]